MDSLPLTCPHCGEEFSLPVEPSDGDAEFVVDCEVCCRPMTVTVRFEDGELSRFDVAPD
ncbi:MAG TPA: CPXCG motif-containing cysteine-rich protein [Opitutaceae bacterium]|nr:CPXCG motif-containing cysteine-rich protein [Opitutaceae bacterium]